VYHGFLRAPDGTITTFDPPGAVHGTFPAGINPAGAITGSYTDANGFSHGFLGFPTGPSRWANSNGKRLSCSWPFDLNLILGSEKRVARTSVFGNAWVPVCAPHLLCASGGRTRT
jgi:hypothetical protein